MRITKVTQKQFDARLKGLIEKYGSDMLNWPLPARQIIQSTAVAKEKDPYKQANLPYGNTGVTTRSKPTQGES